MNELAESNENTSLCLVSATYRFFYSRPFSKVYPLMRERESVLLRTVLVLDVLFHLNFSGRGNF